MKNLKYWTLFFVAVSAISLKAEDGKKLYVNKNDRTTVVYDLDNVRKLTFTSSELVINANDGAQTPVGFAGVRHLTFAPFYSGLGLDATPADEAAFIIYPNPVGNELRIKNYKTISGGSPVTVIDISGRQVLNAKLFDGVLDVSHLSSGIYTIRIGNTTLKFIKK